MNAGADNQSRSVQLLNETGLTFLLAMAVWLLEEIDHGHSPAIRT